MIHKVLSVKQPWAYFICSGIKDIENRTWKCPQKYIGQRVLIHASGTKKINNYYRFKMFTDAQINEIRHAKCTRDLGQLYLNEAGFGRSRLSIANELSSYSAIIGSVRLIDCVTNHPSIWAEKSEPIEFDEFGFPIKYDKKIYNWVLSNPIIFDKPILNVKGKLGFWDYDLPEEYEKLLKQ